MQRLLWLLFAAPLVGAALAAPGRPSPSPVGAQAGDTPRILAAYQAARPADAELGLYRLDWEDSLQSAKERAAKEKRPIFFVSTMQLKDAGDLRGGHC
jgi:hypothetical protein